MIERIISGGQFGADMGGLLGASDVYVSTGGTAPYGWLTKREATRIIKKFWID